jgi:hypothetical protein
MLHHISYRKLYSKWHLLRVLLVFGKEGFPVKFSVFVEGQRDTLMKGVIMQAILPAVRFGVNVKAEVK